MVGLSLRTLGGGGAAVTAGRGCLAGALSRVEAKFAGFADLEGGSACAERKRLRGVGRVAGRARPHWEAEAANAREGGGPVR